MSTGHGELRLRPLREDDEEAFRAAHREMTAEGFNFGQRLDDADSWSAYVKSMELLRAGIEVPADFVPATFLVAEVAGEIVGRTSIRHELNDWLARAGGHIGYAVVRRHRRRGYATEILRQSLVIARSVGVDRVLVVCDEHNVGSAAVIEACGGRFESAVPPEEGEPAKHRYWID